MKKLAFILGAGSSIPYGYPSGPRLIEQILKTLNPNFIYKFFFKHKNQEDGITLLPAQQVFSDYSIYTKYGFNENEIERFRIALLNSNKDSIDSFLNDRREFMDIGKIAIANCILKCEIPTEFHYAEENWLKYLWNNLEQNKGNYFTNRVVFLTFNYDRVVEHFFHTSLKYSFNLEDSKIANIITNETILHLHGVVGFLPWQNGVNKFDYDYNGQNFESHYNKVIEASKSIKIIYENLSDQIFDKASECIREADEVYTIGFGFHYINLQRLKLRPLSKKIICSAYGLTKNECENIEHIYPAILTLDRNNNNSLSFLRNYLNLRE